MWAASPHSSPRNIVSRPRRIPSHTRPASAAAPVRHQIESREEDRPPASRPGANFPRQRKRPPQHRNGFAPHPRSQPQCERPYSKPSARPSRQAQRSRRRTRSASPNSPSSRTSPAPRCPNRKFAPTKMRPARKPFTTIRSMNSSAETSESARSNRSTSAASIPIRSNPASRCAERLNHNRARDPAAARA
jgi:hypothetical protein